MLSPVPNPLPPPEVALPPMVAQRVAVLGHQLASFAEALLTLRARVAKGRLANAELVAFPDFDLPTTFSVELAVPVFEPDSWLVTTNESLPWTSPRARSLLHLPGLKKHWQGLLRATLLADLWVRLPRCWVVTNEPLPPHAAIAGLGLARWGDLARLRGSGWRFRITLPDTVLLLDDGSSPELWHETASRLSDAEPGTAVVETLVASTAEFYNVSYTRSNGRWEIVP